MEGKSCVPYILLVSIIISIAAATAAAAEEGMIALPGCSDRCGNVSVPYPFGIDDPKCAKNSDFLLNCSGDTTDTLFLYDTPVLNIWASNSSLTATIPAAYNCNDGSKYDRDVSINLTKSPFAFSGTRNMFTAVGCDTLAFMSDPDSTFMSGCISYCNQPQSFTDDSPCSGIGCCQNPLPTTVDTFSIVLTSIFNHTTYSNSTPCSYAFLADKDLLDLSVFDLSSQTPLNLTSPVVLDWVVPRYKDCACGHNANCSRSDNPHGYQCKCLPGNYAGNPYLPQGCQDIDECKEPEYYKCHGTCHNTNGNYTCTCPFGHHGDGKESCQLQPSVKIFMAVSAIAILSFIALLIFIICKRKKRERNFIKNGGMMLKHQRVRVFTKAELDKATNNFDTSQLLGEGGFGSVYKGVLEGDLQIAVKRPKDENKIEVSKDFHHEITTVSQMNHKNVVKLLGLCLETKVPLLVYEFVKNGDLFHHIHDKRSSFLRSWKNRLRVAAETALALDYMHSLADPPVIHRDIKSANILLDDEHVAKVADFGASVLVSPGQTTIGMHIQGTKGYLDPEYLMTGDLTEKSDVFSFGVVLVELLTGEKPTSTERTGERRNVIQYFMSVVGSKDLFLILGFDVKNEAEEEEVGEVAELAKACLNANGVKRPTMKEVAEQLAGLMKLGKRVKNDDEETEHLLGESSSYAYADEEHARTRMGQPESFRCFDIESSMPSI